MREIKASAYFGISRGTLNNEKPFVTVNESPFSGPAFDDYVWFKTNVMLPINDQVTEVQAETLQEVTEYPSSLGGVDG